MTKSIELLKLTLQQIAQATGESLPTIHAAIKAGDLQTFLVGRRRFAKPAAVQRWVDHLEAESNAGRPISYRPRSSEKQPVVA